MLAQTRFSRSHPQPHTDTSQSPTPVVNGYWEDTEMELIEAVCNNFINHRMEEGK